MTISRDDRRLLPFVPYARGKRAAITCELKCGDACATPAPNKSGNETFQSVATKALSRRAVLGGASAGAAGLTLSMAVPAAAKTSTPELPEGFDPYVKAPYNGPLAFTPIAPVPAETDAVTVPEGYDWHAIIKWGDPLFNDSPEFDIMNQTPEAQAKQFGYNNDYLDIIEIGKNGKRAVLCCNHEYTNEGIMFPEGTDEDLIRKVAMMAHGFSVVELRREERGGKWEYVKGAYLNRRFTLETPFELTGPVAGSDLVKTKADKEGRIVLGTQNNCAGSTTPWGTILSGEENFNQYFVATESEVVDRYGIPTEEKGRKWYNVDERFDAREGTGYENEVNRFGWVVEIDPMDPESMPKKHTAMGRFKHEAAAVRLTANRHAVAYSGDDQRFDYLYKFISKNRMKKGCSKQAHAHNKELLSEGDLYVARFKGNSEGEIDGSGKLPKDGRFDGRGEWIALTKDGKSMVPGMSIEEVLVYTRLAADKMEATPMDRPEDVQPNPVTGRVYVACTNNKNRDKDDYPTVDEANPRSLNRNGHVIEIMEDWNDAGAMEFSWNLLLVCGDPEDEETATYFGGYTGEVSPISCPDNVAFDSKGNLWVSTDGQPKTIGLCDALHKVELRGFNRGKVEQFLAVPRDAETCGPVIHDKDNSVFVSVQHPGERGTFDEPTSVFPNYGTDKKYAQPAVIQVSKKK